MENYKENADAFKELCNEVNQRITHMIPIIREVYEEISDLYANLREKAISGGTITKEDVLTLEERTAQGRNRIQDVYFEAIGSDGNTHFFSNIGTQNFLAGQLISMRSSQNPNFLL